MKPFAMLIGGFAMVLGLGVLLTGNPIGLLWTAAGVVIVGAVNGGKR